MPSATLCEQGRTLLAGLVQCMRQGPEPPDDASIHAIRVCTKQLRAWLRLVRSALPRRDWRRLDLALSALARSHAAERDATVMRRTLARLQNGAPPGLEIAIARTNEISPRAPIVRDPDPGALLAPYRTALRALRHLQRTQPDQATLAAGLARTHRKAHAAARRVEHHPRDFAALHRLRRWLKYLGYQMDMLDLAARRPRTHARLRQLAGRLGDIHDLVQLRDVLANGNSPDDADARASLRRTADAELDLLVARTRSELAKLKWEKIRLD